MYGQWGRDVIAVESGAKEASRWSEYFSRSPPLPSKLYGQWYELVKLARDRLE